MRRAVLICLVGLLPGADLAQGAEVDGAKAFEDHCSACHAQGGIGTPGLAPPLDRPEFWQALGDAAPDYIAGVVTHGFNQRITVRGQMYVGLIMPPVTTGSDEELAAAAAWVLETLGQTDQTVSAEQIASMRTVPMTKDELRALRPETN